jgi:DNA-binding NarL/FixJ family response regulator
MLPLVKEKNPLVIVLDMYVSEPSGLQVLRELRAHNYRGKVVLLAGTSVSSLISETWHFGVEQVIGGLQGVSESFNLEQVESAIKTALHSEIARRAFELYEARGRTQGDHLVDWHEAERQILTRSIPMPTAGQTETKPESEKVSKKPTKNKKPSP